MSQNYPSKGIRRKFKTVESLDGTAITTAATITVPSGDFGILYKLWINLDAASDADILNLQSLMLGTVTIGAVAWPFILHPYIARAAADSSVDQLDLGPWEFDFGVDGLYSGVSGDNITFVIGSAGAGIKTTLSFIYSGD